MILKRNFFIVNKCIENIYICTYYNFFLLIILINENNLIFKLNEIYVYIHFMILIMRHNIIQINFLIFFTRLTVFI